MRYPVRLEDDENGTVIATVEGVPEAVTVGRTPAEAASRAEDTLVAALRGYVKDERPLPRAPRPPHAGEPSVTLPPGAAAKLALYEAMRRGGLGVQGLAERLGHDPVQVRRLLDLDQRSALDDIEAALRTLGKRLDVGIVDVPA